MKTVIFTKSDIANQILSNTFNQKLRKIKKPFEAAFNYSIPKIPSWLFCDTKLAKITLPSSITQIGTSAFCGCTFLKEIILPESVISISSEAFLDCTSLEKVIIPSSIRHLDKSIFMNCTSLQQIIIQKSQDLFLQTVENAKDFYEEYKNLIIFGDKSLDELLSQNNSIEQIIDTLESEH